MSKSGKSRVRSRPRESPAEERQPSPHAHPDGSGSCDEINSHLPEDCLGFQWLFKSGADVHLVRIPCAKRRALERGWLLHREAPFPRGTSERVLLFHGWSIGQTLGILQGEKEKGTTTQLQEAQQRSVCNGWLLSQRLLGPSLQAKNEANATRESTLQFSSHADTRISEKRKELGSSIWNASGILSKKLAVQILGD